MSFPVNGNGSRWDRAGYGNTLGRLAAAAKGNPLFVVSAVVVFSLVCAAVFGPILAPHDPLRTDLSMRFAPPSREFPLGNDALGRCLLSRILWGARTSLALGFAVVMSSGALGVTIGLISGYAGGIVDEVSMRIADVFFSFPEIIAAMAVAGLMGPGTANMLLVLTLVNWMRYARLVRGITLSVKERDYVKAAELSGVSNTGIILRHLLPPNIPYIIVLGTIGLAKAILAVSALGFLGFGVQPPSPEWGTLLMEGKEYILSAPHLSVFPGIAVMASVLSINILGDFLGDILGR